jgi:hypothetical protein
MIHGQEVIVADVAAENCEVVPPRYIAEIKSTILRLFQIIESRLPNYIPSLERTPWEWQQEKYLWFKS